MEFGMIFRFSRIFCDFILGPRSYVFTVRATYENRTFVLIFKTFVIKIGIAATILFSIENF